MPVVYADDNEASGVIEDIAHSKNSYCYGVSPQQYQIIKNFTSDKFSPELKEKLWKWLVDSSEQAEKDEALRWKMCQ